MAKRHSTGSKRLSDPEADKLLSAAERRAPMDLPAVLDLMATLRFKAASVHRDLLPAIMTLERDDLALQQADLLKQLCRTHEQLEEVVDGLTPSAEHAALAKAARGARPRSTLPELADGVSEALQAQRERVWQVQGIIQCVLTTLSKMEADGEIDLSSRDTPLIESTLEAAIELCNGISGALEPITISRTAMLVCVADQVATAAEVRNG